MIFARQKTQQSYFVDSGMERYPMRNLVPSSVGRLPKHCSSIKTGAYRINIPFLISSESNHTRISMNYSIAAIAALLLAALSRTFSSTISTRSDNLLQWST